MFGLHGKTKRESEAICKQSADRSRSAPGLRANQRATMGAMPLLQSTMSVSLIKGCKAAVAKFPLYPLKRVFFFEADMEEFKVKPLSLPICLQSAPWCCE